MRGALVLVLLAACGDGATMPDAPAPPPDGDFGLVRVQYKGGVPEGNVVMFQNADGSTVLVTRTDADGEANAYMSAGGMATIVGANGNLNLLYTWMGVQPGDQLVLDRRAFSDVPFDRAYQISMPVSPGADSYQLLTACGAFVIPPSEEPPEIVVDLRRCNERTDMLVLPGPDFKTSYLHVADVPLTAIGIALGGTYRPLDRAVVNVSGGPAGSTRAFARQSLIAQHAELYRSPSVGLTLAGGLGQLVHRVPLPAASTLMTTVQFVAPEGAIGTHVATAWSTAKETTPIEVAATRLREYTSRPVFDPLSHRVTWSEASAGAIGDAVLLQIDWFRPGIGENYRWQVLARRGADPVIQLPMLPGRDFAPREGDTIVQPTTFASIAIEGGYDRIRAALLGRWIPGDVWPIDSPAGSVIYEALASPF